MKEFQAFQPFGDKNEFGKKTSILVVVMLLLVSLITVGLVKKQQDIRQNAAGDALTVNAAQNVNPFSKQMLGMGFVNWEHAWGKPFPNEVPGLAQALKEEGVGLIRYAGGLWANDVGFDRTAQKTPYTEWTKNGNTYYFHYGTNELDSLNKLADAIGADIMIQVNISTNDPAMWADMVKYVNIEKGYNFKYWELGNELDFATDKNVNPDTYVTRMKAYIDAMKAVDPTIKIVAGVPASAHDASRQGYSDAVTELSQFLTKSASAVTPGGRKADQLSYHWYEACNSSSLSDLFLWQFSGLATNSWRNSYSRIWSEIIPKRVDIEAIANNGQSEQGITELNFDACNYDNPINGNHAGAIWASDILGRLAYNGLDFATWYQGYGIQSYATIYPNNGDSPTSMLLRPTYYAFYMYNKYFGDQMVASSTYDPTKISIWASTDSKDPGKLKLRITNITNAAITIPVNITGTSVSTGQVYTLSSTNPTNIGTSSNTASAPTTINGVKLNGTNVAGSAASIVPQAITVNGSSFTYTFPAYSSTAMVLLTSPTGQPSDTPTITPTPSTSTPTPTRTPTPSPTTSTGKTGDINLDGQIGITDLSILLSNWNSTTPTNPRADINNSGRVDLTDLSILLSNWGL